MEQGNSLSLIILSLDLETWSSFVLISSLCSVWPVRTNIVAEVLLVFLCFTEERNK